MVKPIELDNVIKILHVLSIIFISLVSVIMFCVVLLKSPDSSDLGDVILFGTAVILISTIAANSRDNKRSRQIQVQLAFFDRWQKLMGNIELLDDRSEYADTKRKFKRYFELIHMEFLMHKHVSTQILDDWSKARENELSGEKLYCGNTFKQWWKKIGTSDKNFQTYMENRYNPDNESHV